MNEEVIETSRARGSVMDHGAHVLSWAPKGHDSVVWVSEHAVFSENVAIRGGVPICFPWFGAGPGGALQPAHGFARRSTWRLRSVDTDGHVATVVHELSESDASSPEFRHPYRTVSTATFGDTLDLALEVTNTGSDPFTFEAALHTYLLVGDITTISVLGLDGDSYLDQVAGAEAVQEGPIGFHGEVDRIYRSTAPVRVVDPDLDRVITVTKSGSASTVVWNPWIDRARQLPDFGDDEWRIMVCVETANIGDAAIELAAGQSHTMSASIAVARP